MGRRFSLLVLFFSSLSFAGPKGVIDPNSFTPRAWEVVEDAMNLAEQEKSQKVEPIHITRALLRNSNDVVRKILNQDGVETSPMEAKATEISSRLSRNTFGGRAELSSDTIRVLSNAIAEADRTQCPVTQDMILIELEREPQSREALKAGGLDAEKISRGLRGAATETRSSGRSTNEGRQRTLERFAEDIVDKARRGKIDPITGRDKEIERLIQILTDRRKNNAMILGDPGVGKTAIVEGFSQWVANNDPRIPPELRDVRVMSLDLGSMQAGTGLRGSFEENLKGVIADVEADRGKTILFIDEVHNIVEAGKTEGSSGAGEQLKPKLARGELRAIGATTLDEYRRYIEKHGAFARRFQDLTVQEPTVKETINMLRRLRPRLEAHYGVPIQESALRTAAEMSHRYISGRQNPDKGIGVLEQACKLAQEGVRDPLGLTRLKLDLKREEDKAKELTEALLREPDRAVEEDLKETKAEIESINERIKLAETQGPRLLELRSSLAEAEAAVAERVQARASANEIQLARLELESIRKEFSKQLELFPNLSNRVTDFQVAKTIESMTGIKTSFLLGSENERILHMEETLGKRIIGQPGAVSSVSDAVRRARTGYADPGKPVSFLFAGPSRVGKTQLSKELARFLFGDPSAMVHLNMGEYATKWDVTRLTGAAPGYVGHEESDGELTGRVRRRPYTVVLLDEVEKADPKIYDVLMQAFDEGRITDSHGRPVDFRNVIFVMTTNLKTQAQETDPAKPTIETFFRTEFLNRVGKIVEFDGLDHDSVRKIAKIEMERIEEVERSKGRKLELTERAWDYLAERGSSAEGGAGGLRRVIEEEVESRLAIESLKGTFQEGDTVLIDIDPADDQKLIVTSCAAEYGGLAGH